MINLKAGAFLKYIEGMIKNSESGVNPVLRVKKFESNGKPYTAVVEHDNQFSNYQLKVVDVDLKINPRKYLSRLDKLDSLADSFGISRDHARRLGDDLISRLTYDYENSRVANYEDMNMMARATFMSHTGNCGMGLLKDLLSWDGVPVSILTEFIQGCMFDTRKKMLAFSDRDGGEIDDMLREEKFLSIFEEGSLHKSPSIKNINSGNMIFLGSLIIKTLTDPMKLGWSRP